MNRSVDFLCHGVGDFKFPEPELWAPDALINLDPDSPEDSLAIAKPLANGDAVPASGQVVESGPRAAAATVAWLCEESFNIAYRNAETFLCGLHGESGHVGAKLSA